MAIQRHRDPADDNKIFNRRDKCPHIRTSGAAASRCEARKKSFSEGLQHIKKALLYVNLPSCLLPQNFFVASAWH
jgi:hypothetical protein